MIKHSIYLRILPLLCGLFIINSCSYLPESEISGSLGDYAENPDYITFSSLTKPAGIKENIFIFYPGGLVDPHAYINPLSLCLETFDRVIIIKSDANLAILPTPSFATLGKTFNFSAQQRLIAGGHSLGGVAACQLAAENEEIEGLILMASYPAANTDLSTFQGHLLSITASGDLIFDRQTFEDRKSQLPEGMSIIGLNEVPASLANNTSLFFDIFGGNHAQFGDYGLQKGEEEIPLIDKDTQHAIIAQLIEQFKLAASWD